MVAIGNITLRLFAAVATFVFSVAACDQATEEAVIPASSVPSHIRSPTLLPESVPTQVPVITTAPARAIYSSPSTVSVPTRSSTLLLESALTQVPGNTVAPASAIYSSPTTVSVPIRSPMVSPEPAPTRTPITLVSSQGNAPSDTSERTPMATPTPTSTPTPTPTSTATPTPTAHPAPNTRPPSTFIPQHSYSVEQLEEWYALAQKPSLPWIWGYHVRHDEGFIGLFISCENKVENSLQALEGLGIPSDAIKIEVIKRPRHDIQPPPPPVFECVPPEVVDPVTGVSEPGFGGLYAEYEVATIYLLEPSQEMGESLVHDELGDAGFDELSEVRVLKGEYTWDQLLKWHQSIRTLRSESIKDGTDGINWGWVLLNPRNNRITINILPPKGAWTEDSLFVRRIEEALLKLGVPRKAVIFVNEWE